MLTKLALLTLGAIIPAVGATRASLLEDSCVYNTYMCCWTRNDNGVQDNTDVCGLPLYDRRLDSSDGGMVSHESTFMLDMDDDYDDQDDGDMGGRSRGRGRDRGSRGRRGERLDDDEDSSDDVEDDFEVEDDRFAAGNEGDVHCHGFVWADGSHFESFILPLYKYVRTFDHRHARGYYGRCVACSVSAALAGLLHSSVRYDSNLARSHPLEPTSILSSPIPRLVLYINSFTPYGGTEY